ncbi:DUF4136 domain-containing protein [Chitinophagaceae bacterium LB-8]|uniref:DUF4136 domain-containing protein n=1 Tax=Paraflavisolibacter caeni TaxID=2982496 RepID=A0A9X2XPV7_9BACT|nr:DUF4136 domain-containing protein [Paraflavisolibacter caeni]MCU7552298.1 DUF4136 domain-containing protein [Paraflavisolibacter caeni]
MKNYLPQIVILALTFIACSCSPTMQVHSDYDKSADFSNYKTFSLYKSDSSSSISQLNQQRIINAVRNEMIKKGYQETSSSPDILVNQVTILKDKVSVSSNTNYYGYGGMYRPYYWGAGGGYSTTNYDVQHVKDGSLIIDIIDARTNKLIWQGIGNKEIDKPIKNPDTKIPQAISIIMADFPPGKSKK